jgi:RTX calcium-binding nonapeptide repeat (4 copies)
MKILNRTTNSRSLRATALAAVAVAATAGVLAGAGNAGTAAPPVFKAPTVENGLLTVEGTKAADRIAVGLQAGQPGILQIDFGDDGSAEFSFERSAIAQIVVEAGNGGDAVRIDESNGVFVDTIPTTIDGGNGNDRLVGGAGAVTLIGGNGDDTLLGGNGNEKLFGGNGDDTIDGGKGNDVAFLGNGNDTFVWDPGEGSDTVEGQNGADTMLFNGAGVAEQVDLSANGSRLKFFRDVGKITMDTNGVERVDFNALGGADSVTVNDLTGTDVRAVNVDLAVPLGGTADDSDVVVNGTNGDDKIKVEGDAGTVKVSGLVPTVKVLHSNVANDRLDVNTLAGSDTVHSGGLDAGAIQLFVDGTLVSTKEEAK